MNTYRTSLWMAFVTSWSFVFSSFVFIAESRGEERQEKASTSATRIISLIDVILEKHMGPPARQQLLLTGAVALYKTEARLADESDDSTIPRWLSPRGLSKRISELDGNDEIQDYLTGLLAQCDRIDSAESVFSNAMVAALPGGGHLIGGESSRIQEQLRANRYVGIGIALSTDEESGLPRIGRVFFEGPAWKVGITSGDLFVEIEGQGTLGKDLRTIVDELRGEDGSDLTVIVRRPDSAELFTKKMTRGRVFIPSVEGHRQAESGQWVYKLDTQDDIAYLKFTAIGPSTLHELRKLASQLAQENVGGLVVDMRLGGGTLHDTILVADGFLESGTIGHVQSLDGTATHEAREGSIFGDLPLAVLIGVNTSGGNSFLAAALQDAGRATLVGQVPRSAAFVNSVINLPDRDDTLMLSTGLLLRRDGVPILNGVLSSHQQQILAAKTPLPDKAELTVNRSTLQPDVVVEAQNGRDQPLKKRDNALKKAVEELQELR